ncbi:class I SAM-dependent methyltransferase [Stutzerimonas stutzeri]|uniref:class I SAM-dependent methyltransferase n=1 Tax=Stutzerimonas stutzeri TaxID=316 RepID=UPI0015E3D34E|nr:class I SAM-dependent methyltransferase [Stutzerimonas stutzeri]MBA1277830.1 methyltransferase domain-containing protein [Stutzerimonas stutzeri]
MTRNDGYVMDVAYPPHFHKEIQPVWLTSLVQFLGSAAPDISKPYSYCELGCGMGINLLIAAITNPQGQFVGVDANDKALHIARSAAAAMDVKNIRFVQADFAQFTQSNNLFFDFIVSHGVWSWIAESQQKSILQLVAKSLKPKGLFYLHYMCHPGATQMMPVQKLLNDLARQLPGSSEQNLQAALDFVCELDVAGTFIDQPNLSEKIKSLKQKPASYLAHDFLTDHWTPQHSTDVHQSVAQAGVTYLGSANAFDNLDSLSVPGAVQPLLAKLASPALRETVKDLARNQHQRSDLFQRAPVRLNQQDVLQQVDALRFQLMPQAPCSGALSFQTPIGEIQGPGDIFSPLLEKLAERPATFAELRQLPAFTEKLGTLSQALQMLMWQGHIHPQRQDGLSCTEQVNKLKAWIERSQLKLNVVEDCGTAIHQPTGNS